MDVNNEVLITKTNTLSFDESELLYCYANGLTESQTAARMGIHLRDIKKLENQCKQLLKANTPAHLISKAWQLGFLVSKTCCLVLIALTVQLCDDAMRQSRLRTLRTPSGIYRLSNGNAGRNLDAI